ncbi:recombinase family protein [Bacillus cereus group sp. BfR-BA-01494]|uniref:recombinase family protein n=1 Tax=Bacillus cereus group sp. BfR-BA-01494 TaxID=2920362 RepID=UPI001F5899DE
MRCAIYRRVSTDEQAEKGHSLDNQKFRLESFAMSQGWEITGDYVDDGYSGKNMERPALKKMFADIDNFDVILVYKLDRFTRSVRDLNDMLETIKGHEIAFKSVTEAIDTTTATGRMILNMMGSTAQWEREMISERIKDVLGKLAEQGIFPKGKPTYGYKIKNGVISIDEEEAEIVKLIFEKSKTLGQHAVSKYLRDNGIYTPSGSTWMSGGIGRIIRNPFYYGEMKVNGKLIAIKNEGYTPLISKEEFDLVNRISKSRNMKKTKRKSNIIYPFSGIALCPRCNKPLRGDRSKIGEKYYTYYRCVNAREGRCTMKRIKTQVIDIAFSEYVSGAFNESNIQIDNKDESIALERKIQALKSKVDRLKELYIDGDITKVRYKEQTDAINSEINSMQDKMLSLDDGKITEKAIEQAKELEKVWLLLDDKTKDESLRSVFDTITLKETEHGIIITSHSFL